MSKSKIVLFIVEGRSDEQALAPALVKLFNNTVKFKIVRSDITSDYASNTNNIEKRIKRKCVEKFLEENAQFVKKDICEIVQIVDLDGAFAPDTILIAKNVKKNGYYPDRIEVAQEKMAKIIASRTNKRAILNHLVTLKNISIARGYTVPYSVYFMSCNLDHVLHNKMNSSNKIADSIRFADKYDDLNAFKEFFNANFVKISGSYVETWDYAKQDLNSLQRGSNFWLCLKVHEDAPNTDIT